MTIIVGAVATTLIPTLLATAGSLFVFVKTGVATITHVTAGSILLVLLVALVTSIVSFSLGIRYAVKLAIQALTAITSYASSPDIEMKD